MERHTAGNFNSTVVQLEDYLLSLYRSVPTHFNSTVVQLEASSAGGLRGPRVRFQFYCSPIRSIIGDRISEVVNYFNSTVVQLEARLGVRCSTRHHISILL